MAAALLASLSAPVALTASTVQAKSATTLRQEAQRILAELNANGNRISIVDEQINQAQDHLAQLRTQIHRASLKIAANQHTISSLHSALVSRAAALYRGAGGGSDLGGQTASSVQQQSTMQVYSQAAAAQDQQRIDSYRAARDASARAKATLDKAEAAQSAQLSSLEAQQAQMLQLNRQEQTLYNQKNSELKAEVIREQKAQLAAEKAASEAAARAARARAAAAAAQQSSGGGGSSSRGGGGPVVGPAPAPSAGAGAAVSYAMAQIGKPYQFAAAGPNSFDCSGLTMMAWEQAGVYLAHSADTQYRSTAAVPIGDAQPGDLAFFGTRSYVHHVGIIIGNGLMVEAPQTGYDVREAGYMRGDLVGIGRP